MKSTGYQNVHLYKKKPENKETTYTHTERWKYMRSKRTKKEI